MKRLLLRAILLCSAALALTTSARADSMPAPVWDYSVTFPGSVGSSAATVPAMSTVTVGQSTVTLIGDSRMGDSGSTGLTPINFKAASTNTTGTDTFSGPAAQWSFQFNITDEASHTTQSLTFTGMFNGTMNSSSSNFAAADNPLPGPQTTTFTATGNSYQVALTYFLGPNLPGSINQGGISAYVTVTPGDLGGGSSAGFAPEPSSLVLCGLGGLACLTAWRRRARQARAAA